ncbi:MAG TPA: ABC transporter ATPase [Flavobacteriales bacterium]|jgi:hypothetical protein|nr:ABC transporter ATPase [Flavobacteriales bacterium]HAW72603.1 ABC transporter ATPase [Flavobacteriales bacterium]
MIDTPTNSWFPDESLEGSLWVKLPDSSRLWVYVADRLLTTSENDRVAENAERFTAAWVAHGTELTASWKLQGSRILLIALDEGQAGASGCSIDASVQFMQRLGEKETPAIDWLRRDQVLHRTAESPVWEESALSAFWMARKAGLVQDNTVVVNTLCANKGEWETQSTPSFQESWHNEMWK